MDFSKHTQGTTSVKVHHAPGERSNFSLAWDEDSPNQLRPYKEATIQPSLSKRPISQRMPRHQLKFTTPQEEDPTSSLDELIILILDILQSSF
jgi:hypothetical protein